MPLHRRLPKRGFTNAPFKKEFSTINVSDLTRFEKGSKVGPQQLVDSGVIRKLATHGLRVLGDGQVDRALHVSSIAGPGKQRLAPIGTRDNQAGEGPRPGYGARPPARDGSA